MKEYTATLFDVDHFAIHDGPGIRATVYFKGCPLRCQWCHSPESRVCHPQLGVARSRCLSCGTCAQICPAGAQQMRLGNPFLDRTLCQLCGRCVANCPGRARTLYGGEYTLEQVLAQLLPDKPFFQNSGGGVTLTGGEVLMQAQFAAALLKALRQEGIHTLVETSGYGKCEDMLALSEYTDVFYFDFKLWNAKTFHFYIGGDVSIVRRNLQALAQCGASIVLRVPMVHGITDTDENIRDLFQTAREQKIEEIHLLPYNHSAPEKYAWLDEPFPLPPQPDNADRLQAIMAQAPAGIRVQIA